MKLIIDIPDYNLDDIQNGSIACGQILKAVKNGIPYEERPQGEWVYHSDGYFAFYTCNRCNGFGNDDEKFCSHCGAKMRKGGTE